jgi:PhnB protein
MILNPYLTFDGNCKAAMTFYHQCLGGELRDMLRFDDMPADASTGCNESLTAEAAGDRIMHACLMLEGQMLMASDSMPGQPWDGFKGCSVALSYGEVADAERAFQSLAEGGQVVMALQETFWAERFGMVTDRFGLTWLINGGFKE